MCGSSTRLEYQPGLSGLPPLLATSAYSPSCSTRMSPILRTFPLFAPRIVTMMIGIPVSRSVLARVPPEASYSATCWATHDDALGSYSPVMGMVSSSWNHTCWSNRIMLPSGSVMTKLAGPVVLSSASAVIVRPWSLNCRCSSRTSV